MRFTVARRVLIADEYHEVGSTVELTDEAMAERLTARGTLVPAKAQSQTSPAPAEKPAAEEVKPKAKPARRK